MMHLFANDVFNAKDVYLKGTLLQELNHVLFKALVPVVGTPKTTAGKRLLATNRMCYRYFNDGDVAISLRKIFNANQDKTEVEIFYNILNERVVENLKTKAGKEAIRGTKFESLIHNAE